MESLLREWVRKNESSPSSTNNRRRRRRRHHNYAEDNFRRLIRHVLKMAEGGSASRKPSAESCP